MRVRAALLAVALPLTASGQTVVSLAGDRLDVRVIATPLSEVLERIASQTGMKVVYDGPAPRTRVTLTLPSVTPVQAVLGVLEGQGLNYALRMDPSGLRVEMLLVVSSGTAGSGTAGTGATGSGPAPRAASAQGRPAVAPVAAPEVDEADDEDPPEPTPASPPPAPAAGTSARRPPGFPMIPPPGAGPMMPLTAPTPAPPPSPGPVN